MLNVCPLTKYGRKLLPIDASGRVVLCPEYRTRDDKPVDSAETLGEFMARVGATSDYPKLWADPDAFVVWANQPTNAFCGGEIVYGLGIAQDETYSGSRYGTKTVYLSRQKDGSLKLAIPA